MSLTLLAYAKLNLTLDVVGRRDDGYHLLDSVMQSVSLCDRVTLSPAPAGTLTVTTDNALLQAKENIVTRALRLYLDTVDSDVGVAVHLQKNIPLAAGLGGGSADAAAALHGINRLHGDPLDSSALEKLALQLGADVPFCVRGGTRRVGGIGEILQPLPSPPPCGIVLVRQGSKPSTAALYNRLDAVETLPAPTTDAAVDALRRQDFAALCAGLGNAFTAVWNRDALFAELRESGADAVSLSGSGSTCFGLFADYARAEAACRTLRANRRRAWVCRPVAAGSRFV